MQRNNIFPSTWLGASLLLVFLVGCEKRINTDVANFDDGDTEYVLAIVVDMSGSCADLFNDGGRGYGFLMDVLTKYQRAVPTDGKVIIAQMSATDNPLLYEGSPAELRRDFPSAKAFRDSILAKSNPSASRLHEGMAATFKYILRHRAVRHGAKPAVFLLSDLLDNASQPEHEQQVLDSLQEFADKDGICGFYFVHQTETAKWDEALADAGVKDYRVSDQIVAHPPLPLFD